MLAKSRYHTDSIHCFLKDAVALLPEIEDTSGQLGEFSYELVQDESHEPIRAAFLITDDASVFRIEVTRIA